ncbi:hypothetical protein VP01_5527g1, partial [Puccinia sorghi]
KINYKFCQNSGKDKKSLRYLDTELNICICFDKLNKTNEPLVPLAFDLYQLPSHNQAINSIQDILEGFQLSDTIKLGYIFLIHNLIKFSTSILSGLIIV